MSENIQGSEVVAGPRDGQGFETVAGPEVAGPEKEPEVDGRQLRNAFGQFPSGVAIVSMLDSEQKPTGITVGSFSSLSLDPALLLFSVGNEQISCRWLKENAVFNVNVLSESQADLAWQFAKPLPDKFADVAWRPDGRGIPLIDGSVAQFVCDKWDLIPAGDHLICIGKIVDFQNHSGEPLVFHGGKMRELAPIS